MTDKQAENKPPKQNIVLADGRIVIYPVYEGDEWQELWRGIDNDTGNEFEGASPDHVSTTLLALATTNSTPVMVAGEGIVLYPPSQKEGARYWLAFDAQTLTACPGITANEAAKKLKTLNSTRVGGQPAWGFMSLLYGRLANILGAEKLDSDQIRLIDAAINAYIAITDQREPMLDREMVADMHNTVSAVLSGMVPNVMGDNFHIYAPHVKAMCCWILGHHDPGKGIGELLIELKKRLGEIGFRFEYRVPKVVLDQDGNGVMLAILEKLYFSDDGQTRDQLVDSLNAFPAGQVSRAIDGLIDLGCIDTPDGLHFRIISNH